MVSIRGAITIKNDTVEEVLDNTKLLLEKIIKSNNIDIEAITAIFFSCTQDIVSGYPAKAARDLGITNASLMCLQEMHVEGSLRKCIRLCIFYNKNLDQADVKHIYLNEAVVLRQDLLEN